VSYTFGAAATSDMNWATQISVGTNLSAFLVCGWWRPTTLTSQRSYFSFGNAQTARVATTTSEIQLVTSNGTTPGVWTTSGAGIAINNWYFLSFLCMYRTATAEWRVWKSTGVDNHPVLIPNTNTTPPVGANGSASGTFYLGNAGTSTTNAFQGRIGSASTYQVPVSNLPNPLGVTSYTTFSQAEEDFVLREYVIPAWQGNPFPIAGNDLKFGGGSNTWGMHYFDLEQVSANNTPRSTVWSNSTTYSPQGGIGTNQGCTFSLERPPVATGAINTNPFPGYRRR
jgi:hypothetical protein